MKKTLLLVLSFTIFFLVLLLDVNSTDANSAPPPVSHAGAPMDNSGLTCAKSGCHSGTALTQTTGVISTNIPGSGYVAGTTYSISVTMSGSSAYGFELTPQTATSNVGLGTWIAGVGTAVSTKYIRQSPKKSGTLAVWTFSWTAPATATVVTFYGTFNYANNNGNTAGDVIKTSSLTVLASTTGFAENRASEQFISVFPNPTSEFLHITSSQSFDQASVYSMDGKLIKTVSEQELLSKTISVGELTNGIYYLQISLDGKNKVSKFVKN